MNRKRFTAGALLIFALIFAIVTPGHVRGQDKKDPYPSMAPLDQYLIADRNAEIALARTAAPPSISRDAKVMVLGSHGYETAVEGKNGFVCMVERAWMNPFDSPEFWNPKNRSPICLNPAAARTVLPITLIRTKSVLAGKSKEEVKESVKAAIEKKELPALEAGAMSYMMSRRNYLAGADGPWHPHLMFWVYRAQPASWGANLPGSPLMGSQSDPDPVTTFVLPVKTWSDGTPDVPAGGAMKMN